jgi:excisionase family DNA binding protein
MQLSTPIPLCICIQLNSTKPNRLALKKDPIKPNKGSQTVIQVYTSQQPEFREFQMALNTEVLSAQEAASLLGAHVETIRRMARKGSIPAFKIGKDWRFNRASLLSWSQSGPALQRKATILAVDTDPDKCVQMNRFLERTGYRIISVAGGKDGLARIQEHAVDLVLLNLTGLSGSFFIREVRNARPQVPIVIATDGSDLRLVMEASQHGPFILISKTIGLSALVSTVRMILEGSLSNLPVPQ